MGGLAFKLLCVVRKDLQEELSYRLNFLLHISSVLMYATIFFFVAKIIGSSSPASGPLARYHGDYFSFVLIGLAFSGYMNTGIGAFSEAIRNEQMMGTLEVMMASPTPVGVLLSGRLLWNFIYDSLFLAVYFFFGIVFLKADYASANLWAIPPVVLLSLIAFNSMGMLSAGFIVIYKRGDPVNMFINFLSLLLGGAYYPIEVMPAALQKIAGFLPITYTLRILRDACIRGDSLAALAPDFMKLTALCAVLLPLSLWFFSYSLRRARIDGTLSHY